MIEGRFFQSTIINHQSSIHRPPDALHYQKSLILSIDPVAADAVALDLFLKAGCQPFGDVPPMLHIEAADKDYHAGVSDLAKIDVVKVKV